jgi:hypothetical protein
MIYSRWRPSGGYDYFETSEQLTIGDDPPAMGIPAPAGSIGTPAQECGYPLPQGARQVGSGAEPRGLIVPTYFGGMSGDPPPVTMKVHDSTMDYAVGLIGIGCGWLVGTWLFPSKRGFWF